MREENGADGRIRTDDLRITSALLYQLSYISPGVMSSRKGGSEPDERPGESPVPLFQHVRNNSTY